MNSKRIGKRTAALQTPPSVLSFANIGGRMGGQGPLAKYFDELCDDSFFGEKTWEKAEATMQRRVLRRALEQAGLKPGDVDYVLAGDLLNQCIGSSFGLRELGIPFFGLYGACSTMGEGLQLGSMTVAGDFADRVLVTASSHFASAEKQFRFPLEYGNQRPLSATWTVTGCGAVVLGKGGGGSPLARVAGITTGKIVDMDFKDSMNMGAAMAMAALDTIVTNFKDLGVDERYYDQIITGDLGTVGRRLLLDYLLKAGHDIESRYMDCGIEIFDGSTQDTHAGGSGCGCSAAVLCGYILPRIQQGEWKRVLFMPTGALLSTVSFNEGKSVPGIAHGVVLERMDEGRK